LEAHGTRCPACGFLLAAAPSRVYEDSLPPRRPRPARIVPSNVPTAVAIGGALLAVIIAISGFWWVRKRDDARAALPLPVSAVNATPLPSVSVAPPVTFEPTALYAKAKAAALAWHTDAALLSIDIAPVRAGHVAPNGKLTFGFGIPAGKRLGPNAPVRSAGFIVRVDADGLRGEEGNVAKSVVVGEPNCIFEDLRTQLEKAGVAPDQELRLHYQFSERNGRGLWRVTRFGDGETVRTFDGASCAVIVHG